MPPTSILFTLPTLSPTFSKLNRVLAICKALDRERFHPLISVDHKGRLNSDGLRLFEEVEVPVYLMRMSPHKRSFVRSMIDMTGTPWTLRKSNIVIQHSSDYSRGWTEPLLSRLGGVRYWIATKTSADFSSYHWRLRLKLATRVIAQSITMAELIRHEIPSVAPKVVIISNGVDTRLFKPNENADTSYLRSQLGLRPSSLVLGCVAHLVPYKDHSSLIQAFSFTTHRNIELVLIGKPISSTYEQNIRTLVHTLALEDRVHFLGLRSDIAELHSVMDGIVLSSAGDSLSNAILQGMSSGLPVISSNVGGMRDAVLPGVNGWLVPRGEGFVERLAAAIDEWAADPQRRKVYGAASRRIVEERFSLDQMVQGHIQLYESLLEQDA